MGEKSGTEESLVISYLALRKTIGVLGSTFPFTLSLGAFIIFQNDIQDSISSYYYTGMRNVFVGTVCVIGFFLMSYRGHSRVDNIAGNLACIFGVCVAFFPTAPLLDPSPAARLIGFVHLICAFLFFVTLIFFSLFLFTKTDPERPPTKRKLQRNTVYKVCGWIMALSILLIVIYYLLPNEISSILKDYDPVFWLETFTVVAFGISWLTKGEAILPDRARS